VVQHLASISPRLCASSAYAQANGIPKGIGEFSQHRFVGPDEDAARAPQDKWMRENIPAQNIVYRATERLAQEAAVRAGVGIGFVTNMKAVSQLDLEIAMDTCESWKSSLWLVTHVDLHRTAKVQAILKMLKTEAQTWQKV
jgi:DNA-binding transcriptional LysR family regulator